jgi:hypothetical protein
MEASAPMTRNPIMRENPQSFLVVAITVTGDAMCITKNMVLRLDTQPARDFLDDYVTVP